MFELTDTHCHIQFPDYKLEPDQVISAAANAGVTRLICVGCGLEDSRSAVRFAGRHEQIWASVGLHPHEASKYANKPDSLNALSKLAHETKVVAIGEAGLDYHYEHSSKMDQQKLLKFQIELAVQLDLPLIFHVREAFNDFWPIFDDLNSASKPIKGVMHSYSSARSDAEETLKRGLYVGLNGIMTFTKNEKHLLAAKSIPLGSLLLETDAPFLTPVPERGKICEPKHLRVTAEFLAKLRGETLTDLANGTTLNAKELFHLP